MLYVNIIFLLIMATNNLKRKGKNLKQKKIENLRRRKKTVFKKVYKLRKYDDINVALILRHNGRLFTYILINYKSWPPSIKKIIRLYHSNIRIYTKVKIVSFVPCS
jgi:hypothetical protein